jgi:4-amino-4-deoxy-L-arabinose transferase-like glycosyltransferase
MDSVQFALALEKYDITVHQPHPPGYFLYIMLGRFLHLFVKDANSTFIIISIIFSYLSVLAIYYLGKEIFDKKVGILSAAIAMTSPSVWFHGEVALTYIIDAFFSTTIAFLCWRIYKGEHKYIWLSAVILGISGSLRQTSIVFLLPLWLFSVKGLSVRKIIIAVGILGVVCILWFIPMVRMTGGWDAYYEACKELWLFNTGSISVFEKGWASFKIFSSTLFDYIVYGVGAGICILGLALYSLIRNRRMKSVDMARISFFSFWILPSVFFYLLIFIHPANPGYVFIFLPALLILTAVSIQYISAEMKQRIKKDLSILIASTIIILNISIFLFSKYQVSYREIRDHDREVFIMLDDLKSFEASNTAIFVPPYTFYGYRHIMYYLPEYRVYNVDLRVNPTGRTKNIFWGIDGRTYMSEEIVIPENITTFVNVQFHYDEEMAHDKGVTIKNLKNTFIYIATGPIDHIRDMYPSLKIRFKDDKL